MLDDLLDIFDRKKSPQKSGGLRGRIGRAIAGDDHRDSERKHYPVSSSDDRSYRRHDDDDDDDREYGDRDRSKSGKVKRAFDFD